MLTLLFQSLLADVRTNNVAPDVSRLTTSVVGSLRFHRDRPIVCIACTQAPRSTPCPT